MNYLNVIMIFSFGFAAGSIIGYKYSKTKYENVINEEIESVKKVYSIKKEEKIEHSNALQEKPNILEYENKVKDYTSFSKKEEETIKTKDIPYIITPDEFGEFDDYSKIELTYFSDKILTDDNYDEIDDIDDVVGSDAVNHFGDYEPDAVYVRNDSKQCDYVILLDTRTYEDATGKLPFKKAKEKREE